MVNKIQQGEGRNCRNVFWCIKKKKYIPLSQPSLINTLNVVYALWIFFFYFLTSSLIFTMHVHTLHTAQPSKQSFLQNLYSYIPFAIISLAFFCTLSSHRLDSVHYYLTKRKKKFLCFSFPSPFIGNSFR